MSDLMILDQAITPARYTLHQEIPEGWTPALDCAIPLADWLTRHQAGDDLSGIGVILEGDDDIAELEGHLSDIPLVALHIPRFADGRCYSHARRIRALWSYGGVLLAFGDVQRDQIIYMHRCGINAFYPREDQDIRGCLQAFGLYTSFYQYNEDGAR